VLIALSVAVKAREKIPTRAPRFSRPLEIWEFISKDNIEAADRVLEDFYRTFNLLAETPRIGHRRTDLTERDVLFWQEYSHLIIYTNSKPLRVVRILHAKRDIKAILKTR